MSKLDTVLRQWCGSCGSATVTRRCIYPPDLCCSGCCAPGKPACMEYDEDDE